MIGNTIAIRFPIRETEEKLARRICPVIHSERDFEILSKALKKAWQTAYPRKHRFKYGSLVRGFTEDQLRLLFSLYKPEEYRFKFYCQWCLYWGLRQGEAHNLNMEQIDFQTRKVIIQREKKEGPQEFPMEQPIWDALMFYIYGDEKNKGYLEEIQKYDGYLFFTRCRGTRKRKSGSYWSTGYLRSKFRKILARSPALNKFYGQATCMHKRALKRRLPQFSLHSFRYSHAYLSYDFFQDVLKVQHSLGHVNTNSTVHYINNYAKSKFGEHSIQFQQNSAMRHFV